MKRFFTCLALSAALVGCGAFASLDAFLAAAGVVVPLFNRLKISPVLGFLAAGVLLGPDGLARLDFGTPAADEALRRDIRNTVRWLVEQGYELGNHTLWHANLGKYDEATVRQQLAEFVQGFAAFVAAAKA